MTCQLCAFRRVPRLYRLSDGVFRVASQAIPSPRGLLIVPYDSRQHHNTCIHIPSTEPTDTRADRRRMDLKTHMGLLVAVLASLVLYTTAQDCSTRSNYCETWVCTYVAGQTFSATPVIPDNRQNLQRITTITSRFGPKAVVRLYMFVYGATCTHYYSRPSAMRSKHWVPAKTHATSTASLSWLAAASRLLPAPLKRFPQPSALSWHPSQWYGCGCNTLKPRTAFTTGCAGILQCPRNCAAGNLE